MGLLVIPLFGFMAVLAALNSSSDLQAAEMAQRGVESSMDGSFRIYENAVAEFAHVHPGFVGAVPHAALELPDWFVPWTNLTNHVNRGRAVVSFDKHMH